jgi:hypothetical protein
MIILAFSFQLVLRSRTVEYRHTAAIKKVTTHSFFVTLYVTIVMLLMNTNILLGGV